MHLQTNPEMVTLGTILTPLLKQRRCSCFLFKAFFFPRERGIHSTPRTIRFHPSTTQRLPALLTITHKCHTETEVILLDFVSSLQVLHLSFTLQDGHTVIIIWRVCSMDPWHRKRALLFHLLVACCYSLVGAQSLFDGTQLMEETQLVQCLFLRLSIVSIFHIRWMKVDLYSAHGIVLPAFFSMPATIWSSMRINHGPRRHWKQRK